MARYLAVLGQNQKLSLAELLAVYPKIKIMTRSDETVIFDSEEKINIGRLGGTPKLAEVLAVGASIKDIKKIITDELKKFGNLDLHKATDGQNPTSLSELRGASQKIFFGLSFYDSDANDANYIRMLRMRNELGKDIKKTLVEQGCKIRWVTSNELALSSVVIKTNKLLTRGFDFNIIFHGGKVAVAKTMAVQDFSDYEFRDMNRPRRDLYSGMTPPKLAKIMINLCGNGKNFLDPFCGSGTFLAEAALLGFQEICGSDASDKAVADTKENMEWLKKFYKFDSKIEVKKCRAEEALKCWGKKFDYIVTEPYLGPPVRGELPKPKVIDLQKELGLNYEKYLSGLGAVLNPGGYLVLIVPFFITEKGNFFLPLKLKENGLVAVPPLPKEIYPELSIRYCRPDQKIGREIFILKKQ